MKNFFIGVVLLVGFMGCAASMGGEVGKTPGVFCQVKQPPDPLLMGTWEAYFVRGSESDYIRYTLAKYGDHYGLYQNRIIGQARKRTVGWRDWIINGKEIIGVPEQYGIRIFVQGNVVYFTMRGVEHPVLMKHVE